MAEVYYKFQCEKNYHSATIDGSFISVGNLKRIILESKRMGQWKTFGKVICFDLLIKDSQTHEEYVDEDMLIPAHTSVLIQRVPGVRHMPIVLNAPPPVSTQDEEHHHHHQQQPAANYFDFDFDFDDFGDDVFAIPAPPTNKEDGDVGQSQSSDGDMGQRQSSDGRGPRTPPPPPPPPKGYICHRCNVRGHFIHHCPTNGDPNFDIKRAKKAPTGIPKLDGSYALNNIERETIETMPCARSVVNLPRCPCCKQIMKDAVLTSKCCFESFCYRCIRDHIISKSMCVCGATNIVEDDLLPNLTLREAVDRILESSGHLKRKRPEIITDGSLNQQVQQQVQHNDNKKMKKKICNAKNYTMPFGSASFFTPCWTSIPS